MVIVRGRNLFELPAKVRQEERYRPCDGRQLVVVEENDASRANETPEIDEVDEDPVEAVVTVDERQVEDPRFAEELRQGQLRLLGAMLHQPRDPRLLE